MAGVPYDLLDEDDLTDEKAFSHRGVTQSPGGVLIDFEKAFSDALEVIEMGEIERGFAAGDEGLRDLEGGFLLEQEGEADDGGARNRLVQFALGGRSGPLGVGEVDLLDGGKVVFGLSAGCRERGGEGGEEREMRLGWSVMTMRTPWPGPPWKNARTCQGWTGG